MFQTLHVTRYGVWIMEFPYAMVLTETLKAK